MSYVQPDLIAWWYKGLYYRDLQMAQCVQLGFLTQQQHDEIKAVNGWWGGYRYVAQSPQRERPESVPPPPIIFAAATDTGVEDEPVDEQPVEEEAGAEAPVDGDAVDGQPSDGTGVEEESVDELPVSAEPGPVAGETVVDRE